MFLGTVAGIPSKTIVRKECIQLLHAAVSGYFCQNTGSGYAQAEGISAHDIALRQGKPRYRQSIDEREIRHNRQALRRAPHG